MQKKKDRAVKEIIEIVAKAKARHKEKKRK